MCVCTCGKTSIIIFFFFLMQSNIDTHRSIFDIRKKKKKRQQQKVRRAFWSERLFTVIRSVSITWRSRRSRIKRKIHFTERKGKSLRFPSGQKIEVSLHWMSCPASFLFQKQYTILFFFRFLKTAAFILSGSFPCYLICISRS